MQELPGQPQDNRLTGGLPENSVATTGGNIGGSNGLTIAQLILSGLGVAFSLFGAGLLLVIGISSVFSESGKLREIVPLFAMLWINLLVAVLCLPSLWYSIVRLRGKVPSGLHLRSPGGWKLASVLLLVWPLVLVAGNFLNGKSSLSWLFLPPLQILAVGIPVWWLVELARWKLSAGSAQRTWAVLDFSLLITTPLVVVIEVVMLVLLAVGLVVWLAVNPDLMAQLRGIASQLSGAANNQQAIINAIKPILQNPLVVFGALALIALLVPMVEELFKPLAVWLVINRQITPAQGFATGALCGAAFALLESLLTLSSAAQEGWAALVIGRVGTALLHITTTSLVGGAIVTAWKQRRYAQLILTYLLAVLLHGTWNALSILTGLAQVLDNAPSKLRWMVSLGKVAPVILVSLVIILFLLLWGNNRRLRAADIANEPTGETARQIS